MLAKEQVRTSPTLTKQTDDPRTHTHKLLPYYSQTAQSKYSLVIIGLVPAGHSNSYPNRHHQSWSPCPTPISTCTACNLFIKRQNNEESQFRKHAMTCMFLNIWRLRCSQFIISLEILTIGIAV
eukprot:scpid7238/ scgid28479/ 